MSEHKIEKIESEQKENKFIVGPGLGLIIMGLSYLIWWVMPFAFEAFNQDMRWAHNWVYAIAILNIGVAWYYKSAISRLIIVFQAFMLPVTASGSFDTLILTYISAFIAVLWILIVAIEKIKGSKLFKDKFQLKTWNWINLHAMVISWILIAHINIFSS